MAKSLNRLLAHMVVTGCTMLINRALLKPCFTYSKRSDYARLVDFACGFIFWKNDFLPKPTLLYRQHGKNDTGAKNWKSIRTYLTYARKSLSQTAV